MLTLLVIISFMLPFAPALSPASGIDLASIRIVSLVLLLLWLVQSLKKKKLDLFLPLLSGILLSFLFLNAFSLFFAINLDWGLRKLAFLLSVFPIFFVFSAWVRNFQEKSRVINGLLWGGALVAAIGIIQFFSQFVFGIDPVYVFWSHYVAVPFLGRAFSEAVLQNPSWLVNVSGHTFLRATATFPDPHMFSFFLNFLIFTCLGMLLASSGKRKSYLIVLALLLLADGLTFSRGGYLGLLGGGIFLFLYFLPRIHFYQKFIIFTLFIALAGALSFPNPVSGRFFSSFDLSEGSNQGRLAIWRQAVEVIQDHPLQGVGLGNYPLEIKPTADYREPIYAHSAYLDIAAETGLLNLIVWLGILIYLIRDFILKARRNVFYIGLSAAFIAFSVHSLVETSIYSPTILTLFLILASFSHLTPSHNEKN